MDVSSTSSTNTPNDAASYLDPTIARTTGKKVMDVDDFLKLITVQLNNQDPLKPMEDTAFIAQMSSFSSLEQMQTLSKDFAAFTTNQTAMNAQNYLGKTVSIATDAGTITGPVTAVNYNSGTPLLVVNGGYFDPSSVTNIAVPAATPATTSTSSNTSGSTGN